MADIMLVTFESVYDDAVWNECEEVDVAGGRIFAIALHDGFVEQGLRVSPVRIHSFYGWSLDVQVDSREYKLVVQHGDAWIVVIDDTTSFLWSL